MTDSAASFTNTHTPLDLHGRNFRQAQCPQPIQVAYRSFDRQWLIPDNRLLVMARPPLWQVRSERQIYVSEQDVHEITDGPALVFSGLIPDLHHLTAGVAACVRSGAIARAAFPI
ncbi:hypothetical protein HNR40_008121 [Nonomuraea endophytica]|uniref:Type ISP restriction-modification enzyme LLaBIII C-terminal specificity domain-containing protein n=1 Tax=Nonomuraea endophytica TaxID=714136 RepID=A0A7W8ACE6_9ACTN|nr:type ISP restriction/modification enzyme [Nonomuraea endophytica]MBB5082625.1 hypothetical protein [Nonomuraea endophytica]